MNDIRCRLGDKCSFQCNDGSEPEGKWLQGIVCEYHFVAVGVEGRGGYRMEGKWSPSINDGSVDEACQAKCTKPSDPKNGQWSCCENQFQENKPWPKWCEKAVLENNQ